MLLSTFERRRERTRARRAAQARSGLAAQCVVVQLRVARGSPRALHAVHAAAAFNIWQVATPSRSREGCAFDRASLPRATFTSYFSLLSIVKKNIIVLTCASHAAALVSAGSSLH